jgi:lauroyl/myristoyl acyltransferase
MMTLWQGLCHLPTSWHPAIGKSCGKILLILAKSRKKIAQANIEACFPNLSKTDQQKLLRNNFLYLGRSFIETGIAWFWSDKRIQSKLDYEVIGIDILSNNESNNGNLIIFKHSQHLELDARLLAMNVAVYGVSRTHNSASMNKIQDKGRLSSIKDTADKNNPRKFMKWLKAGKNVMYAIDQDYGWDHSVKLRFFNQEAATITTTKKIIDTTNSNLVFMNSYYENKKLILEIELIGHLGLNSIELAQKINDLMENKILKHPAEYLWSHRRFKSTLGKNFYK